MNMLKIIVAMLAVVAFAISSIPSQSLAQGGQAGGQVPQPVGGIATVIGVDQPDNCLRIRSGPENSYDVVGCANMGEQLKITGVWTSNDWAQLADNSWVYGPQIQTDLRPPRTAYSRSPSYVVTEEVAPDYYDWGYLPYYGYDTYWYSGIPIFFYNIGVWYRFHPWWWHHGHQAWWWRDGHHGRRPWNATAFNNFVRSGTNRNFVTNRSNLSNVNRFNANRFPSGSTNTFRSRTLSTPNTFRSGSVNTFRSRSFSTPTRTFSTPHTVRNFSSPRYFFYAQQRSQTLYGIQCTWIQCRHRRAPQVISVK